MCGHWNMGQYLLRSQSGFHQHISVTRETRTVGKTCVCACVYARMCERGYVCVCVCVNVSALCSGPLLGACVAFRCVCSQALYVRDAI